MGKKLLYVSPFNLHDTSSGAALQVRTMLESLVKRGIEVKVLSSFVFDSPRGTTYFGNLEEEIKRGVNSPAIIHDSGIEYRYLVCQNRDLNLMTYKELWDFFQYFTMMCNTYRPDIAMGYCVGTIGVAIQAESKKRGVPFVYPLCNANHPHFEFWDCDLIFTESKATANLYGIRDRLNVCSTGIFIDKDKCVTQERDPQYITFVNPSPSKGATIFAKIAEVCKKELPDLKFLVIDTRVSFVEALPLMHLSSNKEKCPYKPQQFTNVDFMKATNNMKEVYKRTKVLLAPSIAYESWGRVISEAVLNKVPCVISSGNGGMEEAMAGAGIAVAVPEACKEDHLRIPTNEEIKPWVSAIKKVLKSDFSKEFEEAEKQLDIEASTDRLLELLEPLFMRKASNSPHIIHNGSLRMGADGNYR